MHGKGYNTLAMHRSPVDLLSVEFIDALLDGIQLRFQNVRLRFQVCRFLLGRGRNPARDTGGIKAMPPAASRASTSKGHPSLESPPITFKTGLVVSTAIAQTASAFRTATHRACAISCWHFHHLLFI
jgi:hypothetical protein